MTDRTLKELTQLVMASSKQHWEDFSCTPVLEFDRHGKPRDTATRCAITAHGMTVVVKLPEQIAIGQRQPWPPQSVMTAMMEALGPEVPA